MEVMCTSLESKMSKADGILLDLNKEISIAIAFLQQLKQQSSKLVDKLNKIMSRTAYLKEFVEVNSFLLRYISFLTEINCKFEMMQISDTNSCETYNFRMDKPKTPKSEPPLGGWVEPGERVASEEEVVREHFVNPDLTALDLQVPKNSEENDCPEVSISPLVDLGDCKVNIREEEVESESVDSESVDSHRNFVDMETMTELNNCFENASLNIGKCEKYVSDHFSGSRMVSVTSHLSDGDSNLELNKVSSDVSERSAKSPCDNLIAQVSPAVEVKSCDKTTPNLVVDQREIQAVDIRPLNISRNLGEEFDIVVEHVASPSEFYVYFLNTDLNLLAELEKRLKSIPPLNPRGQNQKSKDAKACLQKEVGKYALYYSKCDEVWTRVQVTNWCVSYDNDLVYIFLLDYGESKCVSVDTLKPMPDCLKRYPAYAQRCHLYGVCPLNVKEKDRASWGKESSEKMRYLIESSKQLKIRIAPADCYHPPTSLPVTLWLVDKGNACINKLLVESKYALEDVECAEENPPHFTKESKDLEEWNPMKEDFESYENSYDLDVNDPAAVIYGYVGQDYERVCRQFARTGKCVKGDACRKEHKFLDRLGFTTDQEEIYKNAFNDLSTPPTKQVLSVQVTCILKLNQFYCIRSNWMSTSDEESLFTLVGFMNEPENVREMKKLLIPPSMGQIVIAKYSEDESWYRAKILDSLPENDLFTVIFVDYGNKEVLPLTRIRAIEERYLHLPFQAMQCFIYGIESNPKASLKDGLEYLNAKMDKELINIEVISKLPGDEVSLFVNVYDQNGEDIALDLIEKEYAISRQEILGSIDSKLLPG